MKAILLAVLFALVLVQPARAEENPEWFACATDLDCVQTQGVCSVPSAVNVQSLTAYQDAVAKEQAEAKCAPAADADVPASAKSKQRPLCLNQKCEMSGK